MIAAQAAPVKLIPGDHACWFFRSHAEHRKMVTAFVKSGIERGGMVLYLADVIPITDILEYLRSAGLDVSGLLREGRIELLTLGERLARMLGLHREAAVHFEPGVDDGNA